MRAPWILLVVCAASVASAKPKEKAPGVTPTIEPVRATEKSKAIDMKPMAGKLDVYKDDVGNFYVVPTIAAIHDQEHAGEWVFFGDGKTMYQQSVIGSGVNGNNWDWSLWAPRAKNMQQASLYQTDGKTTLDCRPYTEKDGHRVLTQLTADEARAFVQHATFYPPLWRRQSKMLARDDDGVYYFVDQLREEYGGNGYRVFVGMKGAMKEQAMTNVVSDSAGEIYATKSGALKIITGQDGQAFWVKGGKKVELTRLEPIDNKYLIYRDLGIYGSLGAVCDDL